jgi:hypothetical protein
VFLTHTFGEVLTDILRDRSVGNMICGDQQTKGVTRATRHTNEGTEEPTIDKNKSHKC